ncbi:MAG: DinB family protein [Vicinamibacterales bacterium]
MSDDDVRDHIVRVLTWHDAHASFDDAVTGLPVELRGRRPTGLPYSPWQLLEHLRRAQADLLDFCVNPDYVELTWPDDYWPEADAPPDAHAWDASVAAFHRDRAALVALARDASVDLTAAIPHGTGQTYLREILLAVDHNAYHVAELVVARRLLGAWPPG